MPLVSQSTPHGKFRNLARIPDRLGGLACVYEMRAAQLGRRTASRPWLLAAVSSQSSRKMPFSKGLPLNGDTRESLILRLPTLSDVDAWTEFVDIYEPLVYRFARRRGLQDADARDLVQNVLVSVAHSVSRWRVDPQRGRFRAWLFRVARNQIINMLAQRRPDAGSGKTSQWMRLQSIAQADALTNELDAEYRQEIFRAAAAVVRTSFRETTWQAFWQTYIAARSIPEVASEIGMSVDAVYIARSRVRLRLIQQIQQWERDGAL